MSEMKPFSIYLAALILIEMILSVWISYGSYVGIAACIAGSSCAIVQNTQYAYFLGIKTAVWGIAAFTLLFIFYGWAQNSARRYQWYYAATITGTLIALNFLRIQAFVLKQWCSSCVAVDVLMLVIFALSTYEFHKLRSSSRPPHLRKHY